MKSMRQVGTDEVATIIKEREQGGTVTEIARKLGLSTSTVSRIFICKGIPRLRSSFTQDEKKEMRELYDAGTPLTEISALFTVDTTDLKKFLEEQGAEVTRRNSPSTPLASSLEDSIAALEKEAREAQRLAEEKRAKLEELLFRRNLRFELGEDDSVVIIHGVNNQFIAREGLAKLRDWLTNEYPRLTAGTRH